MREADAAALEHVTLFDQSRDAATTLRAFPCIVNEVLAIDIFSRTYNALLQ
jgi:hypothetical protein